MSTDDALIAAFKDPESKEASSKVDAESSTEVEVEADEEAETNTEEVEESEQETETIDDPETERTLSESSLTIVNNFETLSEDERQEKLEKLESSGRKDQIEAAKEIREIYGLEKPEPTIDESILDELVEKKLEALGLSPEALEKAKEIALNKERDDTISEWAKSNDKELDKIKSDREFLKKFHSEELRELPLKQRTKMALYETYGNGKQVIKFKKKEAIAGSANVPPTGDKVVEQETSNLFELAKRVNAPRY